MTTDIMARPQARTVLLDVLLFGIVGTIPALSHLFAVPLYEFEPMRVSLFAAVLMSGRRNSYVLAVGMPLFAALATGHPMPPKMFLIQFELLANVWILRQVLARGRGFAPAAILSVVLAKSLYYCGKFLLLKLGWMSGPLLATDWTHQLAVLALLAGIGHVVWKRRPDQRTPANASRENDA